LDNKVQSDEQVEFVGKKGNQNHIFELFSMIHKICVHPDILFRLSNETERAVPFDWIKDAFDGKYNL